MRPARPSFVDYQLKTSMTAHATTPHTAVAWTQQIANALEDVSGLWICSSNVIGTTNVVTSMVLEIGFGGAGVEVSVVQVFIGGAAALLPFYLPLHIPKGTRVTMRIQGAVLSDTCQPAVVLEEQKGVGWGGYSVAEAIGLNLATSAPTTGDLTDDAWDQAVASTANPYRALTFHPGVISTTSSAAAFIVDVGVGAAASEQALGSWRCVTSASDILTILQGPRFIEVNIPAGERLSIRKNGTNDLTGHLIGWR